MVLVSFVMALLLSGPLANILLNFERAADSLVCGAELAQNHTQEVMQRSAAPLMRKPRPRASPLLPKHCLL